MKISPAKSQASPQFRSLILRPMAIFALFFFAFAAGRYTMAEKSASIAVGDKAPDFSLPSQDGTQVSLKDYLGKKTVVLYFYPKDNTMVCTKEACSFRDSYKAFTDAGAEVIGVSSDSNKSHEDFAAKHQLPFKLLSDSDGAVRKLYGVHATLGVMPGRVTFVIDKTGVVRLTFNSQTNAEKHVTEALKVIGTLDKS